ncbi:Beta-transducin family (WD-40 repeat) protein [Dioscorea alata]|uniref:Beta-transducin family (WD-40 repeat) protein n=1 Tax=Dioscorea alata TaxID=55571 RepID=A0ACB7UTQ3_DIOAL|nr:Beta-transducin family (WD-40 repeat) protein [Dioscorea alata]
MNLRRRRPLPGRLRSPTNPALRSPPTRSMPSSSDTSRIQPEFKNPIDESSIRTGALITILAKGFQYSEMEANMDSSDVDVDGDYIHLEPIDILTKDVHSLKQIVNNKKEKAKELGNRFGRDTEHVQVHRQGNEGPSPMDFTPSLVSPSCEISDSDLYVLEGHSLEVIACAWSPTGSLLASGSSDSTARIWEISNGPCISSMHSSPPNVHVLNHFNFSINNESNAVTALAWNEEGELLATGSYEGQASIWRKNGKLEEILKKHTGSIFSLQWNKRGDLLLTGSFDNTAILWDTGTWECKQQFAFHSAPLISVEFRNNTAFATCSEDKMIYICSFGESQPVYAFSEHQDEINAIQWDPTGTLLASCSDDRSVKIWSLELGTCLHDLQGHHEAVYTIKWSPTGPGTINPNKQLVLASASGDSTIKLWDAHKGHLLRTLNGHREAVYSIAFSPNGNYLASGSQDRHLHIWSVKDGSILKTYSRGGAIIYHVSWNRENDKVVAGFGNGIVTLIDFRSAVEASTMY